MSGSPRWEEIEREGKSRDGKPFDDAKITITFNRTTYKYPLPGGGTLYEQCRYDFKPELLRSGVDEPKKRFLVRRPIDIHGNYVFGVGDRRIIYNYPAVFAAGPGTLVYVTEGEKNADALIEAGLLATTVISNKWTDELGAMLTGCDVLVFEDNDKHGHDNAARAAAALTRHARSIRVVTAAHLWKHLPPEKAGNEPPPSADVVDWLEYGGDPKRLRDICLALPAEGGDLVMVRVADVKSRKIDWLWPGRIARGKLTLLVGLPDVNKSTLMLDMTARITNSGTLPNDEGKAPHGSVIILSAEDDVADTIRPRLEVAGADIKKVHVVTAVKMPRGAQRSFDLTQDLERLEVMIARVGDVVMILIDPYSAYMGKPGKIDSYRSTDVRAVLMPLQEMAARHSVAVVGIGHLNKSGSATALLRVLDSVAFVAASRGVYLVVRDQENEVRRLMLPAKNNIGKVRTGLAFNIVEKLAPWPADEHYPALAWENGAIEMTADEALKQDGRKSESAERAKSLIVEMLGDGPKHQTAVHARATKDGISDKSLRTAKKALSVTSKKIGKTWWWCFPGQEPAEM